MLCKISGQARVYVITEIVYGLSMGMYGFALNFFFLAQGLDTAWIGAITGTGIVAMGVCALPLGVLVGCWGRRKNIYAGGVLLVGLNTIAYTFFPGELYLLPALMIAVGLTMVEVSEIQVMYQSCTGSREKILVYSVSFAAFSLSSAVGTSLAGWLPRRIGYDGTLVLVGIITVAVGIARWRMLAADIPERETIVRLSLAGLWQIMDQRFLAFLGVTAMHGALTNMIGPFANLILKYRCGWSDSKVSAAITASLVVEFAFALYTPRLQRKVYQVKNYLVVYLLFFLCSLGLAFPSSALFFVLLYLLRCGLEVMLKNMIDSVTYLTLENNQKDIYAGARLLTKGLVGAGSAFAVGILLDCGRMQLVFLLAAALTLCAVGLFVLGVVPILKNQTKGAVYHD